MPRICQEIPTESFGLGMHDQGLGASLAPAQTGPIFDHPWLCINTGIHTGYTTASLPQLASYYDITGANLGFGPYDCSEVPSQLPFTQAVGQFTGANAVVYNNVDNNSINYSSNSFVGDVSDVYSNVSMLAMSNGSPDNVELAQATTSAPASLATPVPSDEHGIALNTKPTCLCGRTFARMDSLKRHIKNFNHPRDTNQGAVTERGSLTTQSGGPFHCTFCDRHPNGFVRRDHLRQHLGSGYHKMGKGAIDAYLRAVRQLSE